MPIDPEQWLAQKRQQRVDPEVWLAQKRNVSPETSLDLGLGMAQPSSTFARQPAPARLPFDILGQPTETTPLTPEEEFQIQRELGAKEPFEERMASTVKEAVNQGALLGYGEKLGFMQPGESQAARSKNIPILSDILTGAYSAMPLLPVSKAITAARPLLKIGQGILPSIGQAVVEGGAYGAARNPEGGSRLENMGLDALMFGGMTAGLEGGARAIGRMIPKPKPAPILKAKAPDIIDTMLPKKVAPKVKWYSGSGPDKPQGKYIYVTDNPKYAKKFGNTITEYDVVPQNTLDLSAVGERSIPFPSLKKQLLAKNINIPEIIDEVYKPIWQWVRKYPEIADAIKSRGFDSIAYKESFTGKGPKQNSLQILDNSIIQPTGKAGGLPEGAAPKTPAPDIIDTMLPKKVEPEVAPLKPTERSSVMSEKIYRGGYGRESDYWTPDEKVASQYARRAAIEATGRHPDNVAGKKVDTKLYNPKKEANLVGIGSKTTPQIFRIWMDKNILGKSMSDINAWEWADDIGLGRADESINVWKILENKKVADELSNAGFDAIRFKDEMSGAEHDAIKFIKKQKSAPFKPIEQPEIVNKVAPSVSPQKPGVKEPWEMTQAEFGQTPRFYQQLLAEDVGLKPQKRIRDNATQKLVNKQQGKSLQLAPDAAPDYFWGEGRNLHKEIIEQSLSSGKPVPPEVLADYPDLAAKMSTGKQSLQVAKPVTEKGTMGVNKPNYDIIDWDEWNPIEARTKKTTMGEVLDQTIEHKSGIYAINFHTPGTAELLVRRKSFGSSVGFEPPRTSPFEGKFEDVLKEANRRVEYLRGKGKIPTKEQLIEKSKQEKRSAIAEYRSKYPDINEPASPMVSKPAAEVKPLSSESGAIVNPIETPQYRELKRAITDAMAPLKEYTKQAEKISGSKLEGELNPYKVATAVKQTAARKTETWINEGTTDFDGKITGQSLKSIIEPVKNKELDAIEYAYAKHSLERWREGKNPGISETEAAQKVQDLYTPEFDKFSQDLTAYNRQLLDYVVDAGGLSKKTAQLFRDTYESYIPLFREGFERKGGPGGGKGFGDLPKPIKGAKGSSRQVVNPIAGMIYQTERLISWADRARVGKSIAEVAENIQGMESWVQPVKIAARPKNVSVDLIKGKLEKMGADVKGLSPDQLDDFMTFFTTEIHGIPKDNIVAFWKGGKLKAYQLHPELYKAVKSLDTMVLPTWTKLLSFPKKIMVGGATGLRASFGLVTNPLRDIQTYFMQNSLSLPEGLKATGKIVPKMFEQAKSKLGGQVSETTSLWQRLGGEMATMYNAEIPKAVKTAQDLIRQNRTPKGWAKIYLKGVGNIYREVINVPEAGPRIAEFDAVYKKVLNQTGNERTAWIEALNASKDVTINFTRSGYVGQVANQFVPFLNPTIQGMSKFARSWKERPLTILARGSALTAATVALWLKNKDEDWYKALPNWDKYGFWHFKAGGTIWRIPRPFEWGYVFASIPEGMIQTMYDKNPKAVLNALGESVRQSIPDVIPAVAKPAIEVMTNKNLFTGAPIVPESEKQNLPPEERAGRYTTGTAKAIAKAASYVPLLNKAQVSPRQVEHLIGGYTGGLGEDIIRGIEAPLSTKGQTKTMADVPFIGRLVSRPPFINKFYELLDEVHQKSLTDENYAGQDKYLQDTARDLSKFRKDIKIIEDGNLPIEQKKARIKKLEDSMEFLAKGAITKKAGFPRAKKKKMLLPRIGL